ncbi:hypothetical protein Hanom_Chr00s099075g01802911 [Helianthus anomalus]
MLLVQSNHRLGQIALHLRELVNHPTRHQTPPPMIEYDHPPLLMRQTSPISG